MFGRVATIVVLLSAATACSTGTGNTNDPPPDLPPAVQQDQGEGDGVTRGKGYAERELRQAEQCADEPESCGGSTTYPGPDLSGPGTDSTRTDDLLRRICEQISAQSSPEQGRSDLEICSRGVVPSADGYLYPDRDPRNRKGP